MIRLLVDDFYSKQSFWTVSFHLTDLQQVKVLNSACCDLLTSQHLTSVLALGLRKGLLLLEKFEAASGRRLEDCHIMKNSRKVIMSFYGLN